VSAPERCPKCGSRKGFFGPKYRGGTDVSTSDRPNQRLNERLEYRCRDCEWVFTEPCLDAQK